VLTGVERFRIIGLKGRSGKCCWYGKYAGADCAKPAYVAFYP
jgi:hypothetical protein